MNDRLDAFFRISAAAVEEAGRLMGGAEGRNLVLDYELVRMKYQDIIR